MSRGPLLTDAIIRAAFGPAADLVPPPDLLGSIEAGVRRTPQSRPLLRIPGRDELARSFETPAGRRLAWAVAILALVLALAVGALVGARLFQPRTHEPLALSRVETLTPEAGVIDRVVADGAGVLWAVGPGHLTRFEPDGTGRRTWTISDDPAFESGVVAPAAAGGVWIWWGETIRRFTGEGFEDQIPALSSAAASLTEEPDGDLWAAADDFGLLKWDGAAWVALPAGRPTTHLGFVLVRADDDVWIANPGGGDTGPSGVPGGLGVSHLAGGRWITYDARDATPLGGAIGSIEEAADGSIWVTMDPGVSGVDPGIARFDGRAWSVIDGPGFPAWWLESAPDGLWAVTGRAAALEVARFGDGHWTVYGAAAGLSGNELGHVSTTPSGLYLGTNAGLFRFSAEHWVPAWPNWLAGPSSIMDLAAVSAEEAWAADLTGLWHFVDSTWTGPLVPDPARAGTPHRIVLAADGSLWLASETGVAVLRDGRWTSASTGDTWAIDVEADGTAWIADAAEGIVSLHAFGDVVSRRTIPCPIRPMSLAVAADGSVYLGSYSYAGWAGLARFDGERCSMLDLFGDGRAPEVLDIRADPRGGVVALLWHESDGSTSLVRLEDGRVTNIVDAGNARGPNALEVAPDGDVWQPSAVGLARFDGARWTEVATGVAVVRGISIAPDGTVWFGGPSGVQRIRADVIGR